jgi:hypothetical protein
LGGLKTFSLLLELTNLLEHSLLLGQVLLLLLVKKVSHVQVGLHHDKGLGIRVRVFLLVSAPLALHHFNGRPGIAASPFNGMLEEEWVEKLPLWEMPWGNVS